MIFEFCGITDIEYIQKWSYLALFVASTKEIVEGKHILHIINIDMDWAAVLDANVRDVYDISDDECNEIDEKMKKGRGVFPNRQEIEIYVETHTRKDGSIVNEKTAKLIVKIKS
ncbi:unnamed protein product [Vicia faba]|uniref:Uncharacterized protein n=1 Tax=Vicia faba TaxID=3906 RepID=A0AAV1AC06_VICFA|nr:unnamed protein product [Vicia faba]